MRLILASTSPARRAVLQAAHIAHEVQPSTVNEDAVLARAELEAATRRAELDLPGKVSVLARAKALDVANGVRGDGPVAVLGCDSLFELDGKALGKPHTRARARKRLAAMSGRTGTLHTGHCLVVIDGERRIFEEPRASSVVVAKLTPAEIDAYVATGEPLAVAGSFTLEGYGGPFIERIEGDHHNVLGLSLPALRSLLAQADTNITELWAS
ncbi:Maf family protein [Bowdeniella massiliensis]|uniref:Maf family protein n=1 Tax=Bowdeniella massiliensis TaxID=2932264 RepID=UPI002028861E|nr:Maf family protein [Bowdeniella massiliensis]